MKAVEAYKNKVKPNDSMIQWFLLNKSCKVTSYTALEELLYFCSWEL